MIHEYAMVDASTLKVIGKHVSPIAPKKMVNIPYKVLDISTKKPISEGTCFLSRSQKYWNEVKDPLYLVTVQVNIFVQTDLI